MNRTKLVIEGRPDGKTSIFINGQHHVTFDTGKINLLMSGGVLGTSMREISGIQMGGEAPPLPEDKPGFGIAPAEDPDPSVA